MNDQSISQFMNVFLRKGIFAFASLVVLALSAADKEVKPPANPGQLSSTNKVNTPPPLLIDTEELLLLDEPKSTTITSNKADNAACHVCHANYRDEWLASKHADSGMGCVDCHGNSYAHRNDENNTTPPETMFPEEKIDTACSYCHPSHDAPAQKVIARWQEQAIKKTDPKKIVCTDCHGKHRLAIRTVRWDKKTGKLISTNKK